MLKLLEAIEQEANEQADHMMVSGLRCYVEEVANALPVFK